MYPGFYADFALDSSFMICQSCRIIVFELLYFYNEFKYLVMQFVWIDLKFSKLSLWECELVQYRRQHYWQIMGPVGVLKWRRADRILGKMWPFGWTQNGESDFTSERGRIKSLPTGGKNVSNSFQNCDQALNSGWWKR